MKLVRRPFLLCAAAAAALPLGALAATIGANALGKLEKGRWEVRELDGAAATTSVCIGDTAQLVQFEHRTATAGCTSEVLDDAGSSATVQYSCPGGMGRSRVRVETPRLARIDTQGLSNGRPFSYRLEARRLGAC